MDETQTRPDGRESIREHDHEVVTSLGDFEVTYDFLDLIRSRGGGKEEDEE